MASGFVIRLLEARISRWCDSCSVAMASEWCCVKLIWQCELSAAECLSAINGKALQILDSDSYDDGILLLVLRPWYAHLAGQGLPS